MDLGLTINETHEDKTNKHRENERQRHRLMTHALEQIISHVPGALPRESQVQSLQRIARFGKFLTDLSSRDPSYLLEENDIQNAYFRATNYVGTEESYYYIPTGLQYCGPSSSATCSQPNRYVVYVDPLTTDSMPKNETQSASEQLEFVMEQYDIEGVEGTENYDTNNCNHDESSIAKRQNVIVKMQPEYTGVPAVAMRQF